MSDDEQTFGLDIPDDVQRHGSDRGLITGAMNTPPPKTMADELSLTSSDGLLHGRDVLAQMVSELVQMARSSDEQAPATEYAADLCLKLVQEVQHSATDQELERLSNGHRLLLAGYFYGKLTMPDKNRHAEMSRHAIADIRRQTGFWSVDAERERGKQWMRERASEIWAEDHIKELRIGKVASMVHDDVVKEAEERQGQGDEGPHKHWPKSLDKIRATISKVAPDYATKPGRPPRK